MSMRNWEILAILGMIGVLLVVPVAVFAYQGYREGQEGPGIGMRPASVFVPAGDPTRGAETFANNCSACHGEAGKGTPAAPSLLNIRSGAQFIYTWIHDPTGVTPAATMPKLLLTQQQVADLTAYIMALMNGNAPVYVAPAQKPAPAPAPSTSASTAGTGDAAAGKALFESNCSSCHKADASGGMKIGSATSADLQWSHIGPAGQNYKGDVALITRAILTGKDEKGGDLDPVMPRWQGKLTDAQVSDIIAFLTSLK